MYISEAEGERDLCEIILAFVVHDFVVHVCIYVESSQLAGDTYSLSWLRATKLLH